MKVLLPFDRRIQLFALSAGLSTPLQAQQVSGTAQVADSHTPAAGAAIVLVTASGVIVGGTLSKSDGRYILRAPAAGRFRILARRMGFAPDSSGELRFDVGSELHFDPVLKPLASSLQVVSVEGVQRCEIGQESGAVASRLWEAAQNALSATIAAADGQEIAFRLIRFRRELEPGTGRVMRESVSQLRALNTEPYRSVSPDSLAKTGFARNEGDSSVYFAPDARTLTSEVFTETHCLRPIKDAARPSQIGLGFEPVAHSRLVDVSGVLWFDRASGELRDLDYRYEFPNSIRSYSAPRSQEPATGHIEYVRLDSGGWIVKRWKIRVPTEVDERINTLSTNGTTGDIALRSSRGTRTAAVWEIGGEVSAVLRPADSLFSRSDELGELRGSVVTGPNHAGVAGVTVVLNSVGSTPHGSAKQTGSDGLFVFDSIPAGEYLLTATAASFDTLNAAVPPIPVRIESGSQQTVMVTVPSAQEGRAALCPGGNSRLSVLHGFVKDSVTGEPIAGARVNAYWLTGTIRTGGIGGGLSASAHERTTLTDSKGRYVLCDLEPTTHLLLSASVGVRKSSRSPSLTLVNGGIRMANVSIPR